MDSKSEIILYQPDNEVRLEVRLEDVSKTKPYGLTGNKCPYCLTGTLKQSANMLIMR